MSDGSGSLSAMLLGEIGAGRFRGEAAFRRILTPADAARLFGGCFSDSGSGGERLWVALLDSEGILLSLREELWGEERLSEVEPDETGPGGEGSVRIPVLAMLRRAVAFGAEQLLIAHNHPSGDPMPSHIDIRATRRLCDAASAIGIDVLDHIIVAGGDAWCSFRLMGLL